MGLFFYQYSVEMSEDLFDAEVSRSGQVRELAGTKISRRWGAGNGGGEGETTLPPA